MQVLLDSRLDESSTCWTKAGSWSNQSPESGLGGKVLDPVSVHQPPVAGRAVRVVPHHVEVELVVDAVDGGNAVQFAELLVVALVSSVGGQPLGYYLL